MSRESLSRILMAVFLASLGLWIIHGFLVPLVWSVVLAIASHRTYQKLLSTLPPTRRRTLGPILMTLIIGLLLLGPLTYSLILLGHEVRSLAPYLAETQKSGLPAPEWLDKIPLVGTSATQIWQDSLGTPDAASETLHQLSQSGALGWTKLLAEQVFHRLIALALSLLALFFLYKDWEFLTSRARTLSERIFGEKGSRYGSHAVEAVRGTVNGLLLVGLGEGLTLGIAYYALGVPKAALLSACTGLFAMIPFAAPLIFGGAALFLFAQGAIAKAVFLFAFGSVVLFIADHFIRPGLIGGTTKLPFLWVFLSILGGLESFGLLGLFIGPAVAAVLISIWREATVESPAGG